MRWGEFCSFTCCNTHKYKDSKVCPHIEIMRFTLAIIILDHWRRQPYVAKMLEPIFSAPASVSRIKFEINIIPISVASYVATHAVALYCHLTMPSIGNLHGWHLHGSTTLLWGHHWLLGSVWYLANWSVDHHDHSKYPQPDTLSVLQGIVQVPLV